MTVTNTDNSIQTDGDGAVLIFSYPFKIQNSSQMVVNLVNADGDKTLLVNPTNYSVSINATTDGGNVTMVVAPGATESLLRERIPDLKQETNYPVVGGVSEQQLENSADKLAIVSIYLNDLIDKAERLKQATALAVVGGAVATDLSVGSLFDVAAADDFTLSNPTEPPLSGFSQRVVWRIKQDGVGSRLLTLGGAFRIASDVGVSIVLSTAINTTDYLTAYYNQADGKYDIVSFVKGIV